jgi:hypothetical protein
MLRVPYRSPCPFWPTPCPGLRNASIAPIQFFKKPDAEPRQKQKHRHTVIDPRRATAPTASSSFGIHQFCVNAIASLSYN